MRSLKDTLVWVGVIALAFAAGSIGRSSPDPDVQVVLHQITHYDSVTRWRLHIDTLRAESIVVRHDTALVLIARADSLSPDSAIPLLRRACFTLDTALTTCGERVKYWQFHADTLRSERDTLASLLRRMPRVHGWKTDALIFGLGLLASHIVR